MLQCESPPPLSPPLVLLGLGYRVPDFLRLPDPSQVLEGFPATSCRVPFLQSLTPQDSELMQFPLAPQSPLQQITLLPVL